MSRTLAERQQVTESVLLKRMIDQSVRGIEQSDTQALRTCRPQKFDLASEMALGRNGGMIMTC